jgi:hypothetical protein
MICQSGGGVKKIKHDCLILKVYKHTLFYLHKCNYHEASPEESLGQLGAIS